VSLALPASGPQPTKEATVDEHQSSATQRTNQEGALYAAACVALRLLQDRQQHVPQGLLDPRERKVLKQLRQAVRNAS
jgi:hypothetical protein